MGKEPKRAEPSRYAPHIKPRKQVTIVSEQTETKPEYKATLAEIEAGDMVVVNRRYVGNWTYELRKVSRITPTQIVIGGIRFQRKNGKEIGDRTHYAERVYAPLSSYAAGQTYLDIAMSSMAKAEEERAKRPYTRFLLGLRSSQLDGIALDSIRQAAKLLGYKESE